MPEHVTAVVVTHNRRELLRESLSALAEQTRPVDRILVVDNASTDDSAAMVRGEYPAADVLRLARNEGGAGGFHEGMRAASADGADWIWLMDDDTIAEPESLERLLAARDRAPAPPLLLSSKVVWTDGKLHPMNWPGFERSRPERVVEACAHGLMPLRTATFVSLLVHRDAVREFGLPIKQFFIWSDDIEYTARVTRERPGYLVPDSVAVHKTASAHTATTQSGSRFYFHVRNTLYMIRGNAWELREKPSLVFLLATTTLDYLRFNRFSRGSVAVVARGLVDGLGLRRVEPDGRDAASSAKP